MFSVSWGRRWHRETKHRYGCGIPLLADSCGSDHLCHDFYIPSPTQHFHAVTVAWATVQEKVSGPAWRFLNWYYSWYSCRVRKNALDLCGHFVHFIGEMIMVVLWIMSNITFNGAFNAYAVVVYVYQTGVLSVLLVVMSPTLKHEFKEMYLNSPRRISLLWISYVVITFAVLIKSFMWKHCCQIEYWNGWNERVPCNICLTFGREYPSLLEIWGRFPSPPF